MNIKKLQEDVMRWIKSTSKELGFDRMAYFGHSLTDSDEFFNAPSAVAFAGFPLTTLGYALQFSNEVVYSDLVPDMICGSTMPAASRSSSTATASMSTRLASSHDLSRTTS